MGMLTSVPMKTCCQPKNAVKLALISVTGGSVGNAVVGDVMAVVAGMFCSFVAMMHSWLVVLLDSFRL
jgi:hypothetical protein